jgi:cell division protein FtsW (lipid II flippase)
MTSEFSGTRPAGPLDLVKRLDLRVVVPVLLLVAAGLWSIHAARPNVVASQMRWCAVGFAAACALLLVPYRRLLDLAWPLWGVSVALLFLVLIFGERRNGAVRWLKVGDFGLQPSEFAKVAQVLVMARYIRFRRDHRTFKGLFVPFLITLVPVALIFAEPDLGTAAMFAPVLFAMLWCAGARTKHLLVVVAFGIAAAPVLYFSLPTEHYQRQRVDSFVHAITGKKAAKKPKAQAAKAPDTFQRDEAVAAVATGGALGHAVSEESPPQYGRVPEAWTDFVFVVHAEKWGFAGVTALLAIWAALLGGLTLLASELKDPAARLVAVGAMALLGTQALVNMAMTMGAFPVTGVPLPFVSYGGSSMLASWLLVALVLNAKVRQPVVFSVGDFD